MGSIGSEWNDITHPFSGGNQSQTWGNILGGGAISPVSSMVTQQIGQVGGILNPDKPAISTPGHVPTQGEANQTSLGQELGQEQQMHSTWNILTGGQGVLDTPKTAGPTLLGS